MEKLKILVINNLYPPQVIGGYERAIADYARRLSDRGHQVLVLTTDTPELPTAYKDIDVNPIVVNRCLSLRGAWTKEGTRSLSWEEIQVVIQKNRENLAQELPSFQPDICLAGNMDFLGVEIVTQVLEFGVPVAHYVMNPEPGYVAEVAPKHSLYQYITVSNKIRDILEKDGYPVENAVTIYPGADADIFYHPELPPQDKLRIVYASLVMLYKGIDILIEALYLLHANGIEFSATIAGGSLTPDLIDILKMFIEREGFQDAVTFTGVLSQAELKQLYRTHNVWILPSRFQEPFSIGLIEAMLSGLTIIASNMGGSPEAIEHGESGLIFASEDPLDLVDNLCYLPLHPEQWEAIARQGQQRALSKFTRTITMDQLESVLYQLILDQKICSGKSN